MEREEARLAALTGDEDRAIELYRRYLALHARAEPAVANSVAEVRSHLAQLTGERR
jgi:hypothetical protein